MASKPTAVEIRAYQVGFGDCFLMSFVYAKGAKRHVLIDFGTTGLPRKLKPSAHMPAVARAIKVDCSGNLTAVVATHRHADHISGFATDGRSGGSGKIIAECKPKVILQPWTEDPSAARNARKATADTSRSRKSFLAGLAAMNQVAKRVEQIAQAPPPRMPLSVAKQLRFLGMDNISNKSAIDNLIAMGSAKGSTAVWAHHGSRSGLERLLPGVKVHVFGPPDLTQTEKIKKMRSSDPDQFWQLIGGPRSLRGMGIAPIEEGAKGRKRIPVPAEARWFRDRLATMTANQLLQIVRVLDDQLNNTSLILLFEVGRKKLLFPGDAQIENWSYALEDAPSAARTKMLLADVDVYKVGHHGSRNATPKEILWEKFRKRGKPKAERLQTVISTMPGKHGTPAKRTEVPRKTLMDALEHESTLTDTRTLKLGKKDPLCHTIVIKV
jgi:hypothetical protein